MGGDGKVNELANMYRIGTQSAQLEELIRNTVQSLFLLVFSVVIHALSLIVGW